jgi:hypothetical protein
MKLCKICGLCIDHCKCIEDGCSPSNYFMDEDLPCDDCEEAIANTPEDNPMLTKRTWEEFRASKLLWYTNRMLHLFGWAIVCEVDDNNGTIKDVYPARTKFRGFAAKEETEGFIGLSRYLKDNAQTLLDESLE